jgi:hypothetical protein
VDELMGEMNKIKPPTLDGEHKKEEDVETWLLGMRKYVPTTELFLSFRRKNCDVSTKGKSIHVVGSACAGATH